MSVYNPGAGVVQEDVAGLLETKYMKVDELNFFKKWISDIVQTPDGLVDPNSAILQCRGIGGGSASYDHMKLMDDLVEEGWLQYM